MTERHLTDMELSILACATGSDALRAALAEHLGACDSCLERLQAGLKALRVSQATNGAGNDARRDHVDEKTRRKLMDAFKQSREIHDRSKLEELLRFGLSLAWPLLTRDTSTTDEPGDTEGALPRAAKGPRPEEAGDLPQLPFEHGGSRILLAFRRPSPDSALEAHLIADEGVITRRVSLWIPSRNLSFDFDAAGVAELPGIDPAEIASEALPVALRFSDELPDAGTGAST
jgi:hypothetical protein